MSFQAVTRNSEAAILGRLLQAEHKMNRQVAEFLLSIDFETSDVERMNVLSERAREGSLTAEESAELDSYLHIGSLLSVV